MIVLFAIVFLCIDWRSAADDEPTNVTDGRPIPPPVDPKDIVRYHNKMRRFAGASNMMELRWSDSLAKHAKKWAEKCEFSARPWDAQQNITQNVEIATNVKFANFIRDALFHWNHEKNNYDYDTGQCNGVCHHYLTMIQSNLMFVGCTAGHCAWLEAPSGWYENALYLVCEYYTSVSADLNKPFYVGDPCSQCPGNFHICNIGLCFGVNERYGEWAPTAEASIVTSSLVSETIIIILLLFDLA